MIKGCSKKVIVMHDTGSDMIEEAFFILKSGADTGKIKECDILKHAQTILKDGEYKDRFSSLGMNVMKRDKTKSSVHFIIGLVLGSVCSVIIMLII